MLDQLSLSAWLPAAALILCTAFIFELGMILDGSSTPLNPADTLREALTSMAAISWGGAGLFIVGIVVVTVISQAFEFEAIRILEGYWGTSLVAEFFAKWRCGKYRKERRKLAAKYKQQQKLAWKGARKKIRKVQTSLILKGQSPRISEDMILAIGAQALGKDSTISLEQIDKEFISRFNWEKWAPGEPLRQRINIDKRLRDFPADERVLPTRLGNVLRSYEDKTNRRPVESFIQKVFDLLPVSLRGEHDEQRSRLDLYCSMVFILVLVGLIAGVRLGVGHPFWGAGALVERRF